MKIVITDYPDSMMPHHDYERQILADALPDAQIIVYPYLGDLEELYSIIADADAILTAFLTIDHAFMDNAPKLKCISLNSTGYDTVDLEQATKRGIGVFPVGEYCTEDIAEHALALMFALLKNLKHYQQEIEDKSLWVYHSIEPLSRISSQVLGIFGLGKIGCALAKKAQALGMRVLATDRHTSPKDATTIGVELVAPEFIYAHASIISNHMNLSIDNQNYFDLSKFEQMQQRPIFINTARGGALVEADLITALKRNLIRGAGLDVLKDELPNLVNHPLTKLANVIITPHSGFYTQESMQALQRISCENIVYYLTGQFDRVFKMVN